jgi:hypothetical protein
MALPPLHDHHGTDSPCIMPRHNNVKTRSLRSARIAASDCDRVSSPVPPLIRIDKNGGPSALDELTAKELLSVWVLPRLGGKEKRVKKSVLIRQAE